MNKVTISTWATDAFLGLSACSPNMPLNWSSEWVSRAGNFVESFVLYDKVVLTEGFENHSVLKHLDPDGKIFEFIKKSDLLHSTNLQDGLTFDLNLNVENFEILERDGAKWFAQHDGLLGEADYHEILSEGCTPMTFLRFWQQSLVNEIAEKTHSSLILPLSLQGLEASKSELKPIPYHVEQLQVLDEHFRGALKSIVSVVGDSFESVIDNVPPFFLLLIDQTFSVDMLLDNLVSLRRDHEELRQLTGKLKREVEAQNGISAKSEVVAEWAKSWDIVVKSGFKKPRLLRRKLSSSDLSKALVKPTATISTAIQAAMDYSQESKAYKRFAVYGRLYEELDSIEATEDKLKKNLNVNITHRLSG